MRDRTLAAIGGIAIVAYLVYAMFEPVEVEGRHLLSHGVLRIALLGLLLVLARSVLTSSGKLVKPGLGLSAAGAVLTLVGGIGAVFTDGWNFDPFGSEASSRSDSELWYAYVVAIGVLLFVIGPLLMAIGGRAAGWLAVLVGLGGVLYVALPALQSEGQATLGAVIWLAPWLVLAVWLWRRPDQGAAHDPQA